MRRLAVGSLVATMLFACPEERVPVEADAGAVARGPEALTEAEPNESPDKALAIVRDAEVTASLSADPAKPDQDWYVLEPRRAQEADVTLSGIPGGDVQLEIYDADRNRILLVNGAGEGKAERLPNLYVEGRRFVVVSGKKGTGGAYTLNVRFGDPTPDTEREPNDRAADATPLELASAIEGRLGHGTDEDWYRVELPALEVPEAPAPETPREPTTAPPTEPTRGEGDPQEPARVGSEGEGLDQEPTEGASPAPPTSPPPAAPLLVQQELPSTALRLELSAVPDVRLEIALLTEAQAVIFEAKGNVGEALSLRNVGVRAVDRSLFLVVRSSWIGTGKEAQRGANAEVPYKVTVAVEEAGATAELEPNDDPRKATPLPRDGFRDGFLSPKGDVDYFVLRTEQPVLARFQVSGTDRLDLTLSVVELPADGGKEQVILKANDGAIKEPEILNSVYCKGECLVKVQSSSRKVDGKWVADFENPETPYRLSVSMVPETGAEEREPNDTPARATRLVIGSPIRGTVQPKKDTDFYLLELSDRQVKTPLRATLIGVLKVDVGLYLHRLEEDGKTTLLQTADRAKGDQPETIRYTVEPGRYVFEVRDSKNREANFLDSYQLSVVEDG